MAYVLGRHKVENYEKWRSVFDSAQELRKKNGEESYQIFRDKDNPNIITILNKWTNVEAAKQFFNSNEVKEKMKESGVFSEPTFYFMNED